MPKRSPIYGEASQWGFAGQINPARYELASIRRGRELLSNTGISEKKLPRAVEVEPALVAEPTCGEGGDMQQRVAAHADHFGTIPAKEGARGKSHAGRVGDATQANRAAMALVGESPS